MLLKETGHWDIIGYTTIILKHSYTHLLGQERGDTPSLLGKKITYTLQIAQQHKHIV
jgi:hypothetical protein